MKEIFKPTVQEQLLRSFALTYLLVERSLKIRSKGKVTLREAFIIEVIARLKESKQNIPSVIAKILGISLPSLSVTLKSLLKKKYIEKVLSVEDNRFYFLQLTELGQNFVLNNSSFRTNMVEKTFGVFKFFSDLFATRLGNAVDQYAHEEHAKLDQLEKDTKKTKKRTF